ncbi:hypothetical protein GGR52DRAFT_584876 [Hypoxylon sp. FL1284]|nr:hypothetical protein GGR52DRAFT_584876 [Hypoxylon sp. FL1284]
MNSTEVEGAHSQEALENEIADLELRLQRAKDRLADSKTGRPPAASIPAAPRQQPAHHYLLLLSDSALPLGSFAFSSGLESYLAHTKAQRSRGPAAFSSFLPLSVSSYAGAALPFVLAAHDDPSAESVADLDDAHDAAVVCTVGRRASVAQGRALLAVWEKSMAASATSASNPLTAYADLVRAGSIGSGGDEDEEREERLPPAAHAHLAPVFGAVAALCGLGRAQAAYVFVLGHVKALVSAAVRAGLFGPYHAQRVLAGPGVQRLLADAVDRQWRTPVCEAGQNVPVMDLWFGRHELLYSRIFNS